MRRAVVALGALVACTAAGCPGDPQEKGPGLDTTWARRARAVRSAATPADKGGRVPAVWGPAEDRETGELAALEGHEAPGDVVVDLGPGVWVLDARVLLRGGSLTITGAGSHRTRLELNTETSGALVAVGPRKVTLRGLTVVAMKSGGLGVQGCQDVQVDDVVFASMRYGLDLDGSTARIASSSFVACERGLSLSEGAAVVARETVFIDCWAGIAGQGTLDLLSCVFAENRDAAIDVRLDRSTSLVGCVFAGEAQPLGWKGRPKISRDCLVPDLVLQTKEDRETNRPILHLEEFPDALRGGAPPGMDLVAVHVAIERVRSRGEKDPPEAVRTIRLERADRHAEAAKKALRTSDVKRAREEARLALRYWGDDPLTGKDVPEALVEVADLVER